MFRALLMKQKTIPNTHINMNSIQSSNQDQMPPRSYTLISINETQIPRQDAQAWNTTSQNGITVDLQSSNNNLHKHESFTDHLNKENLKPRKSLISVKKLNTLESKDSDDIETVSKRDRRSSLG